MTQLPFIPFEGPPSVPPIDEFDHDFWPAYPRKVGKRMARTAFKKARGRVALGPVLEGLARYKVNKPAYCDWMHPTTFLNGDHWEDEYDAPARSNPSSYTPEALAIIARYVKSSYYEHGAVTAEAMEQCVAAGVLDRDVMEEKS